MRMTNSLPKMYEQDSAFPIAHYNYSCCSNLALGNYLNYVSYLVANSSNFRTSTESLLSQQGCKSPTYVDVVETSACGYPTL